VWEFIELLSLLDLLLCPLGIYLYLFVIKALLSLREHNLNATHIFPE
jgi:hypothetical protein